jgi:quercetin dioxygenase-like cupin family protein
MSQEDRLREHPKERLAAPFQRVDLAEAAKRLRAEAHPSTSGHRQVALVRRGPVSLILFSFESDGMLKEHQTEGEVTIHVLTGRLEITVGDEVMQLAAAELVSLAPGQPHSVRATEPGEMLLTVSRVAAEG